MDTLKRIVLVVGIAAVGSTIIVAVLAVVTLFMNVATKNDIANLRSEIQALQAQMQTGSKQMSGEISSLRSEVDAKIVDIKTDVRMNVQNHVEHLAKHNEEAGE